MHNFFYPKKFHPITTNVQFQPLDIHIVFHTSKHFHTVSVITTTTKTPHSLQYGHFTTWATHHDKTLSL
jgi:hypothetical protein